MGIFDVTRFNDTVPGLKTGVNRHGDICMTYQVGGEGPPIMDINFSNLARRVLAAFGLEEPKMEKYGVEDREGLMRKELADIQARIKTIESNEMTKEASERLGQLRQREADLVDSLNSRA